MSAERAAPEPEAEAATSTRTVSESDALSDDEALLKTPVGDSQSPPIALAGTLRRLVLSFRGIRSQQSLLTPLHQVQNQLWSRRE